jgi:hypothetical protein
MWLLLAAILVDGKSASLQTEDGNNVYLSVPKASEDIKWSKMEECDLWPSNTKNIPGYYVILNALKGNKLWENHIIEELKEKIAIIKKRVKNKIALAFRPHYSQSRFVYSQKCTQLSIGIKRKKGKRSERCLLALSNKARGP